MKYRNLINLILTCLLVWSMCLYAMGQDVKKTNGADAETQNSLRTSGFVVARNVFQNSKRTQLPLLDEADIQKILAQPLQVKLWSKDKTTVKDAIEISYGRQLKIVAPLSSARRDGVDVRVEALKIILTTPLKEIYPNQQSDINLGEFTEQFLKSIKMAGCLNEDASEVVIDPIIVVTESTVVLIGLPTIDAIDEPPSDDSTPTIFD